MRVSVEYDDATPSHPIGPRMWQMLEQVRDHFPDFNATLFTIPWELRYGSTKSMAHKDYAQWVKVARKAHDKGLLRFALHGLIHLEKEFGELTYESAYKRIKGGKDIFERCELPLLPIFKAPNWAINDEGRKAVKDHGFTLVEDHYYDWNLKDNTPQPAEFGDKIIIAHGHIQDGDGCNNGLHETRHRIMQLPASTTFHYLDEALNERTS